MKKAYFSKKVVEWYHEYYRDLPWRNTQDPYKIWLSEIILQQTRVIQGLPYYKKFIQHYPNINSLAQAKPREVLRMWQGLGYYTRARNLWKCARKVATEFHGKFPTTFRELKSLPGIGDYTAAAIASIAFHEPVAVLDGNVYRVLSRIFGAYQNIAATEGKKFFGELANSLIPIDKPGDYNQAVMEFGALHCLPYRPKCEACIFKRDCFAYQHEQQNVLPVKIRTKKITRRHFYYFLFRNGNKILMTERKGKDIWEGLFDFPLHEEKSPSNPERILRKILGVKGDSRKQLKYQISKVYKHILTHQTILARFIEIDWPAEKLLPSLPAFTNIKAYSHKQLEKLPKAVLITRFLEDRGIL